MGKKEHITWSTLTTKEGMAVGEAVGATVAIAGAIQRFISMQERTKKVCSLVIDKGPGIKNKHYTIILFQTDTHK